MSGIIGPPSPLPSACTHPPEQSLRPPLRVGILIDDFEQPAWICRIVDEILASDIANLVLVVKNGSVRSDSLLSQVWRYRRQLVPLIYDRVDFVAARKLRRPDAFQRFDLRQRRASCPLLEIRPVQKRFSDFFQDADVDEIERYDLDVALRFGFRILRGRVLGIARYGVWSYHHADNLTHRGGPNSFWEVMRGEAVTGSVLQVLSEELDAGKVVYRSWSATNSASLSLNRNPHYWKSAEFVIRKLRDLHEVGPASLEDDPYASQYTPYDRQLNTRPSNLASLPILARFAGREIVHLAREATREMRWSIGYQLSRRSDEMADSFFRFRMLEPPGGWSWSDPFPVQVDERYYVLLTAQSRADGRSHIAVVELEPNDPRPQAHPVLVGTGALTYPSIVRWKGELFLVPHEAGRGVSLYRCRHFPDDWSLESILLDDPTATNATLAELDGRWWMFVNLAADGASPNDELHLFSGDSLLGPWKPHRQNPVRSDVRAARPGGSIFHWRGQVYRPAQDWSVRGRQSITIHCIVELTDQRYYEIETGKIAPRWRPGLVSNRTLNHVGRLTCIDAATTAWRRPAVSAP